MQIKVSMVDKCSHKLINLWRHQRILPNKTLTCSQSRGQTNDLLISGHTCDHSCPVTKWLSMNSFSTHKVTLAFIWSCDSIHLVNVFPILTPLSPTNPEGRMWLVSSYIFHLRVSPDRHLVLGRYHTVLL